jgi:hypothetical protein
LGFDSGNANTKVALLLERLVLGLLVNGKLLVEALLVLAKIRAIKALLRNIEADFSRIPLRPTSLSSLAVETGKAVLRDCIKATIGFEPLAEVFGKSSKSLTHMFGPRGDPRASHCLPSSTTYSSRRTFILK